MVSAVSLSGAVQPRSDQLGVWERKLGWGERVRLAGKHQP